MVGGDQIYPHRPDLKRKQFWYCDQGHPAAWVGIHPGTRRSLGELADQITRYWRGRAHADFDPIWQSKKLTRTEAYAILAELMQLSKSECHIGCFDYRKCKQVIELSAKIKQDLGI